MKTISNKEILEKLNQLQMDVNIIKENLVDPDTILTSEEERDLDKSLEEYRNGKTFTLEEVKRSRKNA